MQMWKLPPVNFWTPLEFEKHLAKLDGIEEDEGLADAAEAEDAEIAQESGSPAPTNGDGSGGAAGAGSNANGAAGGKAQRRKGPTLKERLQRCQRTERERLTFGKVCLWDMPHKLAHLSKNAFCMQVLPVGLPACYCRLFLCLVSILPI